MVSKKPRRIVIYFESAQNWISRNRHRFSDSAVNDLAVWLMEDEAVQHIAESLKKVAGKEACDIVLVEHSRRQDLLGYLNDSSIVWNITDGVAPFHGSYVPALVELFDVPRFGNSAFVQMLAQDKFRFFCACQQLGIGAPKSVLFEADKLLSSQHYARELVSPLMVKPNNLGASIGINDHAKVGDLADAARQSKWIWDRYRTSAIVQDFIEGTHVRAVYMRLSNEKDSADCVYLTEVTKSGAALALGYIPFTRGEPLEDYRELRESNIARICRNTFVTLIQNMSIDDYCAADLVVAETGKAFVVDFNACPFLDNASFQALSKPGGSDIGDSLWAAICSSYSRQKALTTGSSSMGTLKSQK